MIKNSSKSAFKEGVGRVLNIFSSKKNSPKSIKKSKSRKIQRTESNSSLSFTTKAVLGGVAAILVLVGMVSLAKAQISISEKQKILDELNAKIAQQKVSNDELEQKLNGSLDEYIEDYARDKLDMVKPGERVYINTAGN